MNTHNTVVDFPTVPVPLPAGTHRIFATLGRARLIHATDRIWMGVIFGHDLLASISEFLFIPFD